MSENEWMSMSEEEAIAATIQCINLDGDDTLPCILCPGDGMGDGYCQAAWNITVNALKDISKYRNMEKRLAEHYGECDQLLEVVVDGLCKHPDIDIGTPIKSRLLTDEDVDKWEAYKSIGTVEECREAVEKQKPKKPRDVEYDYSYFVCDNCGESIYATDDFKSHKFCLNCGQAIKWKNLEGMEERAISKLKKCPFCGGPGILKHKHWCIDMQIDDDHDLYWVECDACGSKGTEIEVLNAHYRSTVKEELSDAVHKAITAWNRRSMK